MAEIKYILFDAANTLIHKPALWTGIAGALAKHNIAIDDTSLQYHHKLVSEMFTFPDRTSAEFYKNFNSELLYSLGIIPGEQLLADVFSACTYLPWEPFTDTGVLKNLPVPVGILSNFNSSLTEKMNQFFGPVFSHILISENLDCAKPQKIFFDKALEIINIAPEHILYVGDSLKLDMQPAEEAGMNACLIDRLGVFKGYRQRIHSLEELSDFFY